MKIGIGITNFNRRNHLDLCLNQIKLHTKCEYNLFVAQDIPNIAKAKNECLFALKECEYIFLFDDDCFPIHQGWVEYFTKSGHEHLLYLTNRHNQTSVRDGYDTFMDSSGCFMYIHRSALEKVGYFNSEYKQYGFEHAGYSKRIQKDFISLPSMYKYLYSLDLQGEGDFGVRHKPSITDFKAMQESIDYNRKVYEKEINGTQIYYDYKP